ncbi:hypothetical protein CTI12_AA117480 [Artemisia annua]|uniref:Uncharacterized protein n=1 Tax=Artemisia annua TaxID=35608 RepID=A0A2U1PSP8_ARTAN|nr:hypothetical protein CTI12_AA117480 [Artemisia annua]
MASHDSLSEATTVLNKLDDQMVSYRGRGPIKHTLKQAKRRGRPSKFPNQIVNSDELLIRRPERKPIQNHSSSGSSTLNNDLLLRKAGRPSKKKHTERLKEKTKMVRHKSLWKHPGSATGLDHEQLTQSDSFVGISKDYIDIGDAGQNYHRMGTLLPEKGKAPKFAQQYIYDKENEIQHRIDGVSDETSSTTKNNVIDHELTVELRDMLNEINPLVAEFRMAGKIIEEIYPDLKQNLYKDNFFQEKSILAPTHELVDMINDHMLQLLE